MNDLFPGENIHLRGARGQVTQWTTHDEIDWKARVVCGDCNNGWMSDLENDHAKPVLTPLITGDTTRIEINQQAARSIDRPLGIQNCGSVGSGAPSLLSMLSKAREGTA
jgi:hypothetical protein